MPVEFIYNTPFNLENEKKTSEWLQRAIVWENFSTGEVVYAFFNDEELKKLNNKHLGHNYYTDVISFNDSNEKVLSGNIAISVDRVKENSVEFNSTFHEEMRRVMLHGLLHLMGYNDLIEKEKTEMRNKEDEILSVFHVEQ